jgi:hypothetical protein
VRLTARRANRYEVWTAPQSAGGTRVCFLPQILECTASVQLDGMATMSLELPLDTPALAELLPQRVLRVWEDDTRFDEWRIAARERIADAGIVRLSGDKVDSFLALRSSPVSQLTGGIHYYNIEIIGLKPSEIIDQYVLPALAVDGITWLARGTIDQDVAIDLSLFWDTPLSILRKIADALTLELQIRRNGTTGYYADLLTQIGSSAARVDVRYRKNLVSHSLKETTDDQVNRVFPKGAVEENVAATIARASWKVTNVAANVVTLADPLGGDGPIAFDNQLVGKYLRRAAGTLTLISASSASAQTVTVASAVGVATNDLVQFRATVGGDDLTWLDSPADQTISGVVTGWPERPEIPGTNNVIPNPALRDWPSGDMPTGYTKIGAPTTSKETTPPFFRTGPWSLKVIAAAGEGIQSPAGSVFPTANKPFGAGFGSLWVASGQVRFELVLTTGGTVILPTSPEEATNSLTGQWEDLGVSGDVDWNALLATAVAVRVIAQTGGATFYLDRVQATYESPSQQPFVEGSGGTKLWQVGNELLLLRGAPPPSFTISMADLNRADPVTFPLEATPELGGPVTVTDARVLSAAAGSRIAALRINYRRPGDTQLTVSTKLEDLSGSLARIARTARVAPATSEAVPDAGPSLDVQAVNGATDATINYTVTADVFDYQVDNGGFTSVPASGFTVSRPAAGATSKALEFRARRNDQVISNTIHIPAIDKDTVSPDLSVVQTSQSATTTSLQATASNPGGGAAPTITVSFVNCSGVGYGGAGPHSIASGTTVVVNRPTFGLAQATVKFAATIASAGTEEISRTVPMQDFHAPRGAQCNVNPEFRGGTATGYSVYDLNGTGRVTIAAQADATAPNGSGQVLKVHVAAGGAAISPGIGGFTLLLAVDAGVHAPGFYHQGGLLYYIVKASIPVGYTLEFQTNPFGTGGTFEWLTPVAGTGTWAVYVLRQQIGIGGTLSPTGYLNLAGADPNPGTLDWYVAAMDVIDANQPEQTGPTVRVWAVESATDYTIYHEGSYDSLVYRTDNGGDGAAPGSGFTVSRNAFGSPAKVLTFTATKAGQTKTATIEVPPATRDTATPIVLVDDNGSDAATVRVRVKVAVPNAIATVTIDYEDGGLTVSPASGGTLTPTNSLGTTAYIDYEITRPVAGSSPVRVSFTASATGYASQTDGVDVYAVGTRSHAKVSASSDQSIGTGADAVVNWSAVEVDVGDLHDSGSNTRLTIPTGGGVGVWLVVARAEFDANATGSRVVSIFKNGSLFARTIVTGQTAALNTVMECTAFDVSPAAGDYYEVKVFQSSGGNLNLKMATAPAWRSSFQAIHLVW